MSIFFQAGYRMESIVDYITTGGFTNTNGPRWAVVVGCGEAARSRSGLRGVAVTERDRGDTARWAVAGEMARSLDGLRLVAEANGSGEAARSITEARWAAMAAWASACCSGFTAAGRDDAMMEPTRDCERERAASLPMRECSRDDASLLPYKNEPASAFDITGVSILFTFGSSASAASGGTTTAAGAHGAAACGYGGEAAEIPSHGAAAC